MRLYNTMFVRPLRGRRAPWVAHPALPHRVNDIRPRRGRWGALFRILNNRFSEIALNRDVLFGYFQGAKMRKEQYSPTYAHKPGCAQ